MEKKDKEKTDKKIVNSRNWTRNPWLQRQAKHSAIALCSLLIIILKSWKV